ncbi:rod shape-determining protein MreD [Seohaeicola saemankumensis]|jgi:rod shape-determining protein MreD|uniref:rod shape-determining protein MreD n=1 Tax=Seohaeicola TaxID=481178 RepID=UPI0007F38F91|nr:rod shape-determining protein MreD [Paracoccaceae bacterium]OAN72519.1 rod shape-determining protein MreD [Rhodobacteraceae bacterium EhC02]
MAEGSTTRVWGMRMMYLALALVLIFAQLMPLDFSPQAWAGPDLLVAFTFAWALRRPEFVPALSIGLVVLLADLLFLRPPGLWAALMVLGTQALRNRARNLRDQPFVMEWLAVAGVFLAISVANRLVLAILMVPQAPLGLTIIHVLMTLICYPVVVMLSQWVFGVRKAAPGDLDRLGQRI